MFLSRALALLCVVFVGSSNAFQLHRHNKRSFISMKMNNENQKKWSPKALLPALLGAFYAFSSPEPSSALPSGGHSGSSRSNYLAPSTRSYSSGPTINIMPSYSPFGYSTTILYSNLYIDMSVAFVETFACLGLLALIESRFQNGGLLSARHYDGSLRGVAVMKLTVSLDADWNQNRNIMSQLSNITSKRSSMTDKSDLAKLLSETSLALLRTRSDWTAASFSGENYRDLEEQKAETTFQQFVIKERSKFEEEAISDSGPVLNMLFFPTRVASGPKRTQAVVSIIVVLSGKSEIADLKLRDVSDVSRCLEQLAADGLTYNGENVRSLKVLWSPSTPDLTLSEGDLTLTYPELMRL